MLTVMILCTLAGIASIVVILFGDPQIGGFLALAWIPAAVTAIEWRCQRRISPRGAHSAVVGDPKRWGRDDTEWCAEAKPVDVRINIPANSPRSK